MKKTNDAAASQVSRRSALKTGAAVAAFLASPAIIRDAKAAVTTLKLSSVESNDPKLGYGRWYLDLIQKNLKDNGGGDEIAFQFFPSSQLGSEMDVITQMKLGAVDMMVTSFTSWSNIVPELGVFDLGYIFDSFDHESRALDVPVARSWLNAALLKAGAHVPAIGYYSARSCLTKFPFAAPGELAGKKIRCINSPMMTNLINTMGAAATPIAFGEVYSALSSGVLDGLETTPSAILGAKLYENAKYYVKTEHVLGPACVFVGDVSLKKLTARSREQLIDAIGKAEKTIRGELANSEKEQFEFLVQRGVTVSMPDQKAFRARVQPIIEKFSKDYPGAKPMLDAIAQTRT